MVIQTETYEQFVEETSENIQKEIQKIHNLSSVIPENPHVTVGRRTVTQVRQTDDKTYDKTKDLSCSDSLSELIDGECVCVNNLMQDVGQGCRYEQPVAFISLFKQMLYNASHVEDEEGEDKFPRINKHGNDERRDRVLGMVEQMERVLPRLLRCLY